MDFFEKRGVPLLLTFSGLLAYSSTPLSQELLDSYGDAFLAYEPLVSAPSKPKQAPAPVQTKPVKPEMLATPTPALATAASTTSKGVSIEWLRKNYSKLEDIAIDNPSKDNLEAYLYVRRLLFDKSQTFAMRAMEVTNEDPLLNENTRVPYASLGAQSIRNADYRAQGKAVEHMAKTGGLIVFVDGSCRFCAMQLPVIAMLKDNYKLEALVVSIDGTVPKDYKGSFIKDTGLFRRLELKLTPSVVFVNKPQGYRADDPNLYHIVSQGFYALDELTKQISFAGFKSNLLTAEIAKDLNVWSRGVLATNDINSLSLDANNPASIKKQVAPLLLQSLKE
jgi:conjugal transfer pilus assembly protein TraF